MRQILYAILAVPAVAALIAGITFLPTILATSAVASPQPPAQINNQALEQDEISTDQNDDNNEVEDGVGDDQVEDEVEENVDASVASQAKLTPSEAADVAANYLSLDPSAVQSIELENEGDLHYSIAIVKENQTYDIEVNAITGTVGNVEQED